MVTFSINPQVYDTKGFSPNLVKTQAGLEYLGELWIRRATGSLDADEKRELDVDAYAFVAERNNEIQKKKRETPILRQDEIDSGFKGTIVDTVASFIEENIDDIADSDEYKYELKMLMKYRKKCIIELGVDLAVLLCRSLENDSVSVQRLKKIVDDYELYDMMSVLCSRPNFYTELVAVADI